MILVIYSIVINYVTINNLLINIRLISLQITAQAKHMWYYAYIHEFSENR